MTKPWFPNLCFGRGVEVADPQRSLPTPNIVWFCVILPACFSLAREDPHYLLSRNALCLWEKNNAFSNRMSRTLNFWKASWGRWPFFASSFYSAPAISWTLMNQNWRFLNPWQCCGAVCKNSSRLAVGLGELCCILLEKVSTLVVCDAE